MVLQDVALIGLANRRSGPDQCLRVPGPARLRGRSSRPRGLLVLLLIAAWVVNLAGRPRPPRSRPPRGSRRPSRPACSVPRLARRRPRRLGRAGQDRRWRSRGFWLPGVPAGQVALFDLTARRPRCGSATTPTASPTIACSTRSTSSPTRAYESRSPSPSTPAPSTPIMDAIRPRPPGPIRRRSTGSTGRGLARVVETGARFLLNPRKKHDPTLMDPDPVPPRRPRSTSSSGRSTSPVALGAEAVSFWSGALPDSIGGGRGPRPARRGASGRSSITPKARGVRLGVRTRAGDVHRYVRPLRQPGSNGSGTRSSTSPSTSATSTALSPATSHRISRTMGGPDRQRPHRGHGPRRPRSPHVRRGDDRLPPDPRRPPRDRLSGRPPRRVEPPRSHGRRGRPPVGPRPEAPDRRHLSEC